VYFLNPHGIIIGQGGVVNVGSLHLQTPTADYMKQLLNERGEIRAIHEQMLFSGNVPISPSGVISVKGKINAVEEIQLSAGDVELARTANLRAGRQVQVDFGGMVNTQNLNWGNDLVVTPEGKIKIVATNDVSVAGKVNIDAAPGKSAGQIEIRSGNDIHVNAGADISARGVGANSDGGEVVIFADRNSYLEAGAVVDVSAPNGTGGFLEFSAKDTVNIQGNGLRSSYGGTILIDPDEIVWNGAGHDVFSNGATYRLEADKRISLTDVVLSSRQVSGTGRTAHETGASTGNSGNIILEAPRIELTDSQLLSFATGNYNAGDIILLAVTDTNVPANFGIGGDNEIILKSTVLDARADTGKPGNITIQAIQDGSIWDSLFAVRSTKISIDESSKLYGNDIFIQAVTFAGMRMSMDEVKDGEGNVIGYKVLEPVLDSEGKPVVDSEGNPVMKEVNVDADYLENLEAKHIGLINGLSDDINYWEEFLEKKIDSIIPLFDADAFVPKAEITIGGTLEAQGSIDIFSTAGAVSDSQLQYGIKGIAVSVGVVLPESKITIGSTANLTAINGDIAVESVVLAEITQSTLNKLPDDEGFGVVAGVGVIDSKNEIIIEKDAQLTASKGNIKVAALTERSVSMSAAGGKGPDSFAATIALVIEKSDTLVTIGGKLTAVDVDVYSILDVTGNTISAGTTLGTPQAAGWFQTRNALIPLFGLLDKGAMAVYEKFFSREGGSKPSNNDGAGVAAAIMVDINTTKALIAGTANIKVTDYLRVEALTHNVPVAVASTTAAPFPTKEGVVTQENTFAFSLPLQVVLQETIAEIQGGATISASGDVIVNAVTESPYNLSHPLLILIEHGPGAFGEGAEGVHNLITAMGLGVAGDATFGIDKGLFNTWSQTSIEVTENAIALMLSVVVFDAQTVARIGDGVTISGNNLSVTASNNLEMGHVVGNIRSFLSGLPNLSNPAKPVKFDSFKDFKNSYAEQWKNLASGETWKKAFGDIWQSVWGNQGSIGVGAGIMFNYFDSTAIAEIGGATLNVKDILVDAQTHGFDLLIGIGASKSDDYGINGTVGTSIYNVNAWAKIDAAAKINADGGVKIQAKDDTLIVSVGGIISVADGTAFGLTAMVPIAIRDIRAVWGNYLDEEDDPAALVVESAVEGDVTILAEAQGTTITAAISGSVTSGIATDIDPDKGQKMGSIQEAIDKLSLNRKEESWDDDEKKLAEYQEQLTIVANTQNSSSSLGISGAVAVNLLIEEVYAGINGNVKITAKNFDVKVENKAENIAVVGALVIQAEAASKNTGIAGGVGVKMLVGATIAFVDTTGGTLI
jgi:hypothetical protein